MVDTTQRNGGFVSYPDRVSTKTFFRSSDRFTKSVTIKSGQVLKGLSFLESDAAGKCIAHSGFSESAVVTFTALTAGQTLILAGLTFTAGGSGTTAAQLATSWAGIADGTAFGDITSAVGGSFTAGALTGYFTEYVDADTVLFNSSSALINATNVAATGTGASAATITITAGTTTKDPIAGVLCFDVDASSGDVQASAYTEASFWADALVWAVDTAADTITLSDGTTVACTSYNTGCSGTSDASNLLKQKFVEGSGFSELGFLQAGESY